MSDPGSAEPTPSDSPRDRPTHAEPGVPPAASPAPAAVASVLPAPPAPPFPEPGIAPPAPRARPPPTVELAAWTTALAAILLLAMAVIRLRSDLGELRHVDAVLYDLSWIHPQLAVAWCAALGLFLLVVAAGVWSGWPWTRPVAVAALAAAPYAAVRWSMGSHEQWVGLVLIALSTFSCVALAAARDARRWFDGQAFATSRLHAVWERVHAACLRAGARIPLAPTMLALIAIGVVARVATLWTMDLWADGATYSAMGDAWSQHHEFLMPWGDITSGGNDPPAYSHHYPPLYPFYLGLVYSAFGFGVMQTKVAAVALALVALGVVYLCSRDLYGKRTALLVTGIMAVEPHLVWSAGTGFSENMVLVWFTLTMWGIAKSLEKPPYILAAGAAAGLAYLTRSSVGPFFLVAGVGGLLWRLHFQRWKALANGWYLAAAALFVAVFLWWANRNVEHFGGWPAWDAPWTAAGNLGSSLRFLLGSPHDLAFAMLGVAAVALVFHQGRPLLAGKAPEEARRLRALYAAAGGAVALAAVLAWAWVARNGAGQGWPAWETSTYTADVSREAFGKPDKLATALLYKSFLFLMFFGWYAAFLLPELRASWRRIRDEHESALWLAVLLIFIISWFITSQFWVHEGTSLFWFDNHRYIVIAFVPLLWALLRKRDPESPALKLRTTLLAVSLAAFMLFLFFSPVRYSVVPAAEALDGQLVGGEVVAFHGSSNKYLQYPYMTRNVTMIGYTDVEPPCFHGSNPDYVIAVNDASDQKYPCYHEIGTYTQQFWSGGVQTTILWAWGEPPAESPEETPAE